MDDREPTIRRRELGEGLRAAMQGANFTGKQLAHKLKWSEGRVSRLLNGKRGGSEMDVIEVLAVCGATAEEKTRLLALCREADTPGWLQKHGSRLPKQLVTLVEHENRAVSIWDFQSVVIHGLLQTAEYARALTAETGNVPPDEIDDRVSARLARQALLSRQPPLRFVFFIHEFAFKLPIGGAITMSEQMHHILRLLVRPNISVRVVPAAIGGHPGIAGPFQLMEFQDFKPVVYLDSETSCLFLEEPVEISAYRRILSALADKALDEGQSREFIANLAMKLYPPGEEDV
ncbi:helix-turn-helix domain-containing protein [Amycolatopsis sp. CA-230715]|uniref:helix-turn-helix domain-containing protein n=1 Tax=Amycolatopsis sp. CA-230715 TaxID=2745196 RepID=UPI001C02FE67|nr:helix-turn-helix transcriptional regulator [Amycolatopsis sp. CA-230715]